ncbi:hypothetical protein QJ857_gp0819 [Tupanvirus soda lake]|uniref:Uncharacterized protein n=2 Tax=Tupanvirus TaxID=2094720 RepID=A0A6N1NML2_9VIRU|nr:hypothetical protein QJ857_gp0819 [Tupanvirus soda lake]QKU35230.1 hypothetical protein [Tupanvirus soda lake]
MYIIYITMSNESDSSVIIKPTTSLIDSQSSVINKSANSRSNSIERITDNNRRRTDNNRRRNRRVSTSNISNLPPDVAGINAGYVYENADILEPNEIYDLEGRKIKDLNGVYALINIILHDIFDVIIKSKLHVAKSSDIPNYKYEVFGGKALERIINPVLTNIGSFDFDIELDEPLERIANFSRVLSTEIGSYIDYNFGPTRHFIKNILHKHNLIDEECFDHYTDVNNKLIYHGTRLSKFGNKKFGIFLNLLLKKNLFTNGKFNNFIGNSSDFNVILYPLCDIKPTNSVDNSIEDNKVNYAPLPKTLYGYVDSLIHDTKVDKNISRLKYLANPNAFICNPNLNFPVDHLAYSNSFLTDLSITSDLDYEEIDEKIDVINNFGMGMFTNGENLITNLVTKYYTTYISNVVPLRNNCYNYLDSLLLNPFKPKPLGNLVIERTKIINELRKVDNANNNGIYIYTGGKHNSINMYRQLVNLGLENNPKSKTYFTEPIQTYEKYGQDMDAVFDTLYKDVNYISMVDNFFNDEFEVISSQTFLYFNSPNGKISDAISVSQDKGSIIYMPNFLSTASKIFPQFQGFLSPMKVLYKIKIKNELGKGKNWILIHEYSQVPHENEILIKAGSYFVIEDIDFVPISVNMNKYNVKLITMRLCNNYEEAIDYAKNFADIHLLYGRFGEDLFTGGSDITSKFLNQKPNYIVNPYTVMIDVENLDPHHKNLSTYEDLVTAYIKHYPLFSDIIDKYNKRVMITNTELLNSFMLNESIKNKKIKNNKYIPLPTQKSTLHRLEIPGLYSETESNYVPPSVQTGGENDDIFRKKYLKYKYKYLSLKNNQKIN